MFPQLWQHRIPKKNSDVRFCAMTNIYKMAIGNVTFWIHAGLPMGRCDKSSRAEFQNSMCDIDLFFQQEGVRAVIG